MDHTTTWEIGVSADSLDELFSGEQAGMNLWFLAGYVKGLVDGSALLKGESHLVLEPVGEGSWRLRCSAAEAERCS
jgi:hypothetical protein